VATASSNTPLFSELGFSQELYEIRQRNGNQLLIAAWIIEVIACFIGLFISALIIATAVEEIGAERTPAYIMTVVVGALPFLMCAVVELMKIPLVTLVYHSKSILWKAFFIVGLLALSFVTFETALTGLQQGYQLRTEPVSNAYEEYRTINEELKSTRAEQVSMERIDTGELDQERRELVDERDVQRLSIQNDYEVRANELRANQSVGAASTLQEAYNQLRAERDLISGDRDREILRITAVNETQSGNIENRLDATLTELRSQEEDASERLQNALIRCDDLILGTGACQRRSNDSYNEEAEAISAQRGAVNSSSNSELDELRVQFEENLALVRAGFDEKAAILNSEIESARDELNIASSTSGGELTQELTNIGVLRDERLAELDQEYSSRINSVDERIKTVREPNSAENSTEIRARIDILETELKDSTENFNRRARGNQVYQIAKIANSLLGDDDNLGEFSYTDLSQAFVDKVATFWFGSLAVIISTTGILLAMGAMVLKYEHIDEHRTASLWFKSFSLALLRGLNYLISFLSYFPKILKSIRLFIITYRKRLQREPIEIEKIVEKEIEVLVDKVITKEVIKEIPVEKIVTNEVIKEVPVEKIIFKNVDRPVTVTQKEFIYVPFYTDDPEERGRFQERMEKLKEDELNNNE
jgi:hypothetical protein